MSLRKAVKDLLDALQKDHDCVISKEAHMAMVALRQALAEPYVPMTEIDQYRIKDSFEYATSGELGKIAIVESAVLARLGIEVGK